MRSKRVQQTLYLMLEARTLNRWEFSKSPIVWGNHRNKGTIRQVSTNQRVWDQVNKQTQLVPWMKDRAQREKQGKWKGDRGFHKEKKQMKGRHRTGARGWETRVDTWTNDVASSSQAESGQREEWRAACKKQKKYKDNKKNEGSRANLKTKSNYKDQDNEKNERPRAKSHLKESLIAVALLLVASAAGIFFSRNGADFSRLTAEDGGAVINCPNRIPPGNFYLNWQKYTSWLWHKCICTGRLLESDQQWIKAERVNHKEKKN